jgi:hypothetical protein
MAIEVMIVDAKDMLAAGMLALSALARRWGWFIHISFLIPVNTGGNASPRVLRREIAISALLGLLDFLVLLPFAFVSHMRTSFQPFRVHRPVFIITRYSACGDFIL